MCILHGGDAPYILRSSGDHYRLVLESSVHGVISRQATESVVKNPNSNQTFCPNLVEDPEEH